MANMEMLNYKNSLILKQQINNYMKILNWVRGLFGKNQESKKTRKRNYSKNGNDYVSSDSSYLYWTEHDMSWQVGHTDKSNSDGESSHSISDSSSSSYDSDSSCSSYDSGGGDSGGSSD